MSSGDDAVAFARQQLGKPYLWGATGPNAFDCSGLVFAAWKSAGVSLGRTTYQQILDGVEVAKADLMPGDLVFPDAGHVQIYVGGGQIIEAPHSGATVRQVNMWGFWRARRVGAAGTGGVSLVDSASAQTVPAWFNPANPLSWLPFIQKTYNDVQQVEKVAGYLISPEWWKRVGVFSLGLLLLIIGAIVMGVGHGSTAKLGTDSIRAVGQPTTTQ